MKGKTLFITGAADGIGKSIAKLFAAKGWTIGILDVQATKLQQTLTEIGERATGYTGSITSTEDVSNALKSFTDAHNGQLDLLINNAGILRTGEYDELAFEDSEAVIHVNLIGLMRVTKLALPYLKKAGKSRIINLASISAVTGVPRLAAYAASKAAVKSLTETWSITFAKHGIAVCDILPHIVSTQMAADNEEGLGIQDPSDVKLTPDDVAKAVLKAESSSKIHHPVSMDAKALFYLSGLMPTKAFLGTIKKILNYK